jgi:hypothetical protein
MESIILSSVAIIFIDPLAVLDLIFLVHSYISAIKQSVDVPSKQQAVAGQVRTIFRSRA